MGEISQATILYNECENCTFKLMLHLTRANELNRDHSRLQPTLLQNQCLCGTISDNLNPLITSAIRLWDQGMVMALSTCRYHCSWGCQLHINNNNQIKPYFQIITHRSPTIGWYKECHLWVKLPSVETVILQEEIMQYTGYWCHGSTTAMSSTEKLLTIQN